MPRRRQEDTVVQNSDNLIADLIGGTQFKFIGQDGEEGKGSLSDKPKVETPVYALNDLLGGGLPLGAILEVFGPNAAGKSSMMYETLGNFQKQYPNGVAFIIDSEASTDDSRLRQLGVDPARAPRMGASSLEDGFEQIIKILKKMVDNSAYKGFPVFILWDTIAATPTRAQLNTGEMYGGGMAERARILKTSLTNVFTLIEKQNVLLVLLNQVMAEIGGWRPGLTSAGGNALKHDVHMRLEVDGGRTDFDGVYATQKNSSLNISKSKVSPLMNGMPIIIDITKGGVIDRGGSLLAWMMKVNPALFKQSQWWEIESWVYEKYKPYWSKFSGLYPRFRQARLWELARGDQNFVDLLQLIWLDLISERYVLQKEVCAKLRSEIEAKLMVNLQVSYEELNPPAESPEVPSVSAEDLSALSGLFGGTETSAIEVNQETGEVTSTEDGLEDDLPWN